jgi:hypothetical protein
MPRRIDFLLAGALAFAIPTATAQALHDPDSVVLAGLQVTETVDDGHHAAIWEAASPAMKRLSIDATPAPILMSVNSRSRRTVRTARRVPPSNAFKCCQLQTGEKVNGQNPQIGD